MKYLTRLAVLLCVCVLYSPIARAQDEISSIAFDTVPGNTALIGGGTPISLEADTNIAGSVEAIGEVATGVGIRFPDLSLQTTASSGASITANSGLYNNTIIDISPPSAYTEVCVKGGSLVFDIHAASEPTSGGNCQPGDTGWILERFERESADWAVARLECLKVGMRLPEPFEWKIGCINATDLALDAIDDNWEWSSNAALPVIDSPAGRLIVSVLGNGSCSHGSWSNFANGGGTANSYSYRCAR